MKKILLATFIIAGLMMATSAMAYIDGTTWLITAVQSNGGLFQDTWNFTMPDDNFGSIESVDEYDDDGTAFVWTNWRGVTKVYFRFPKQSVFFYGAVYTTSHSGSEVITGVAYDYINGWHGSFWGVLDD